jgi:hypothetical protein
MRSFTPKSLSALPHRTGVEGLQPFDGEVELFDRGGALVLRQELRDARIVRAINGIRLRVLAERREATAPDVIGAGERASPADRPGERRRVERKGLLDLVEEIKRIPGFAVHLVDESNDRDVAQTADLEQFACARLDALGRIDDHDGRVDGGKGAVGVLGKVLVAGRVEQVENAIAVFERHHRGHDGNAAVALDAHPVGAGLATIGLGAHFAGELNRAAEQEQLFSQRRLARVRVRNDREGASARDGVEVRHGL